MENSPGRPGLDADNPGAEFAGTGYADGFPVTDERTADLINHGRQRGGGAGRRGARPAGLRPGQPGPGQPGPGRPAPRWPRPGWPGPGWLRAHWRAAALGAVTFAAVLSILLAVLPGGGASWPASVAQVKADIEVACQNPDVAAEPSQLNFACGADTRRVLWVFALLTSGNNPAYVDKSTGRAGLVPIQPDQGGAIAWSLNLHHPYDPADPVDSLQVAARAVNNIIGGATLTTPAGAPLVQPGLESKAANCQRYTGSAQLVSRKGYPPRCAQPVTAAGRAQLVGDAFAQWTGGAGSGVATAASARVLFAHADDPGDPQVQSILSGLSGRPA